MHMFTALYDKLPDAEAAQKKLKSLGIVDLDAQRLYDRDHPNFDGDINSTGEARGIWNDEAMLPPDDDRHLHEEHLRRGGYLLTVTVDDQEAALVHEALEHSNAVDVEERHEQYRSSGFVPPIPDRSATIEEVIPLVTEELRVGKRDAERGGVRVRSYVVETPVRESIALREEHVSIERRPVGEQVATADFGERTIEAREHAEEAVVAKQTRVVEEVVVRKDAEERVETVRDTVRHTEIEVEQLGRGSEDGKSVPR